MTLHNSDSNSDNSFGTDVDPRLTPNGRARYTTDARAGYRTGTGSHKAGMYIGHEVHLMMQTYEPTVGPDDGKITVDSGYTILPLERFATRLAFERPEPAPDWYDTVHAGAGVDVLRGLPDNSIDAIVTGPPWKTLSPMPATRRRLGEMWTEIERVLRFGAKVCIIGPSGYRPSAAHAHAGNGTGPLGLGYFLGTKPGEDLAMGYQIINYEAPVGADVRSIAEELIVQHTCVGDVVLDPAAGEGEVLIAAANLGRHYLGLEKTKTKTAKARRRLAP